MTNLLRCGLIIALFAIAPGLLAGTMVCESGDLRLTMNDTGGSGAADGGWTAEQDNVGTPAATATVLVGGYFSLYDANIPAVHDGLRDNNWTTVPGREITAATAVGPYTDVTSCAYESDNILVEQYTYAEGPGSSNDVVILAFRITNNSGTTLTDWIPSVWFDFNAGGNTSDQSAYDATERLCYQYKGTDPGYIGVKLMGSIDPRYFNWPDTFLFPSGDLSEIAEITQTTTTSLGAGGMISVVMCGQMDPLADGETAIFSVAVCGGPQESDFRTAGTDANQNYGTDVEPNLTSGGPGPGALTVSTSLLTDALEGQAYTQTLSATGGAGSSSYIWSATGLPSPLVVTGSQITGTPAVGASTGGTASDGIYSVTITVSDGTDSNSKTLQLTVGVNTGAALALSTNSLADATVGEVYSATLSATGGTTPYSWSITGLPAGLTATDNTIGGTPTGTAGASTVTITVVDSAALADQVVTTLTLTVISGSTTLLFGAGDGAGGGCAVMRGRMMPWAGLFGFVAVMLVLGLRRRRRE